MKDAFLYVMGDFQKFIGNGSLIWCCYGIALIFCFFFGKEKRKNLFAFGVLAFAVLLNPLVYWILGTKFMSGVYWRLFWIFPMAVTIGVVLTEAVFAMKKNLLRLAAVAVLCVVIAKTGTFFFNGNTYCVPENDYQIPQAAVDVSDGILAASGGEKCLAVVPDELLCYIRQYTTNISLFYGRNVWGYINSPTNEQMELYRMMNAENIDYQALHDTAYAYNCDYIVFNSEARKLPEQMETYGYKPAGNAGCYVIYSLE